jgi:hypothetical protein
MPHTQCSEVTGIVSGPASTPQGSAGQPSVRRRLIAMRRGRAAGAGARPYGDTCIRGAHGWPIYPPWVYS